MISMEEKDFYILKTGFERANKYIKSLEEENELQKDIIRHLRMNIKQN